MFQESIKELIFLKNMIPGKYCPWIEVSGANAKWCPSCNGKYTKSKTQESNGYPVYIGVHDKLKISNNPDNDLWYIESINEKKVFYESYVIDQLIGKYDTDFDDSIPDVPDEFLDSIATAKCVQ